MNRYSPKVRRRDTLGSRLATGRVSHQKLGAILLFACVLVWPCVNSAAGIHGSRRATMIVGAVDAGVDNKSGAPPVDIPRSQSSHSSGLSWLHHLWGGYSEWLKGLTERRIGSRNIPRSHPSGPCSLSILSSLSSSALISEPDCISPRHLLRRWVLVFELAGGARRTCVKTGEHPTISSWKLDKAEYLGERISKKCKLLTSY